MPKNDSKHNPVLKMLMIEAAKLRQVKEAAEAHATAAMMVNPMKGRSKGERMAGAAAFQKHVYSPTRKRPQITPAEAKRKGGEIIACTVARKVRNVSHWRDAVILRDGILYDMDPLVEDKSIVDTSQLPDDCRIAAGASQVEYGDLQLWDIAMQNYLRDEEDIQLTSSFQSHKHYRHQIYFLYTFR